MTQHTPTPWEIEPQTTTVVKPDKTNRIPSTIAIVKDPNDNMHQTEIAKANAEFIVRACNSHDALLKACKGLMLELEKKWGCGDLVHIPHNNPQMEWLAKWSDKLQSAIAKATE